MKTFILMWRPSISSYKMEDLEHELREYPDVWYNWSVWEHEKAHEEDRFFMVRVGEGKTGVVMSGYFSSDPYEDEDWSGKGRQTFYMDMQPDYIFHPENTDILTTEQLTAAIPDFNWTGGHSGRMLTDEQAEQLEDLWEDFLSKQAENVYDENELKARRQGPLTIEEAIRIANEAHFGKKDLDGNPVILHPLIVGLKGRTRDEMIVGFLHDVVEDTRETFTSLLMKGVDRPIVEALKLLTHENGTDYYDYIQRIIDSGNSIAIHVKQADIQHNLERGRAGGHLKQVAKHEKAWNMIKDIK
ncbi:MAG: hypothetical protein ILA03_00040 [Bacteroidaceae bacterium]|nr:hypothetical protein [Bacteroidaceae bacterium]MBP3832335.1 hypothetical protein [Bacteroidaceae bacterium]